MTSSIQEGKFVELRYKTIDKKTGEVLTLVEFPIGYVQGANETLSSEVTAELEGKSVGEFVEVPVDTGKLYGARDESLVFTDHIDNVPEEYREVGLTITMENSKGEPKNFIVTRVDEKSVTIDGNNPLCGREVLFRLEILSIRDATDEEIAVGGAIEAEPEVDGILKKI
jgi:FKBP-type peptidyl-prolyl cis-trans isomerase SlyD